MTQPASLRWRPRQFLRWPFRRRHWVWLAPFVLYNVVLANQFFLKKLIEALIGLVFVVLVARRPYKAVNALVLLLPINTLTLAFIYRMHIPGSVVRGLGFWKEGVIAALAVAAITQIVRHRPRFDWADRLALGYLSLGIAYLVAQPLFVGNAVGAHLSFYARELGWRSDVLFVGIFFICRHIRLDRDQIETIVRRVLIMAVIMAVVGVYEFLRPWSYNHFVTGTLQLGRYQANVLHAPLPNPRDILAFGSGSHRVRIGSLLINYLQDGWYYVLGLSIASEMIVRGRARGWLYASLPVLGGALIFTQSRAAILAGGVAMVFSLRSRIGRSIRHRVRISLMVLLLGVAAFPLVLSAGLGHRFVASSASNSGHTNSVRKGIQIMGQYPLGRGLATGAGGGQDAIAKGNTTAKSVFIPEDQWLQIGTQLGVLGLGLYVGVIVLIIRKLRPRTHDPGGEGAYIAAGGLQTTLIALLVGGLFLQTFTEQAVSWTVFALCGLAVAAMDSAPIVRPKIRRSVPALTVQATPVAGRV